MGFGVWGLGFGVRGCGFGDSGLGVWGLGLGVWVFGFGVWGLGSGVCLGCGCRVLGAGMKVWGEGCRVLVQGVGSRVLCGQAMHLHQDSENDNSGYGKAAERKRNTLIDIDLRMANAMPAVFKSWLKSPDSGQTEASTRKKIKSSETQCGPFPSGFRIWI